ncbi:AarF/ABC1/UbiB kinase family protein [bacterium]|nr:AarF/ABC1/UbiB kinase family protein [bacterium]
METRIGFINRTYRHINRYWDIMTILVKHGLGEVFKNVHLNKYIDFGRKKLPRAEMEKVKPLTIWERIRLALEELGPTFIKFGQIMSNRPDLLPPELIVELEKLQDSVPPFSDKEARELIEQELEKPVGDLFADFDAAPFASASIAQAHKAVLKSGERVVLKVQRPGIESAINVDIEIMKHLAAIIDKNVPGADNFNPVGIVDEFERSIKREINFNIEANSIEKFAENFKSETKIYVPAVYREYTTPKVLTLEYVDGIKISKIESEIEAGNDPKVIAKRGADLLLEQIFEHGFFHADPHPGNILVLKDNVICFIDFGMMGTLHPGHRDYLAEIMIGVVNQNAEKITRTLLKIAGQEEMDNYERMEMEVADMIDQYSHLPLKAINIGDFLTQAIQLILKYKLKIPGDIYVLSKALITIEGIGRKLDPEFDMISHIEPFARKLMMEPLMPGNLIKDIFNSFKEFLLLLQDLPSEIKDISGKIKRGKFKVEIEHKGLNPMLKKHDQISNRIAFAIVLASLIIGSSLIVLSGIPPRWNDIPIIGIVGFVGAGLMGFWLLISILRHGKL